MILVRHAHAGSKKQWGGRDELRPLSEWGSRQASSLVPRLAAERIDVLWSSPTIRCRETLVPLARARGLAVTPTRMLAKETPAADVLAWLLAEGGSSSWVVCTHGEVLDGLHHAATAALVPGLVPKTGTQKGAAWLVTAHPDGVPVYLPPEPSQLD